MKKPEKKLSLDEAARRIVSLTEAYLARLPGAERKKKRKAFQILAADTSTPLPRASAESRAKPGESHRTPQSPVAARTSVSARGRR